MIHKDLEVYKESMLLIKDIFDLTRQFPKEELFSLTAQMRRASYSIPCNIAEGAGRKSRRELLQFLNIALGSLIELETQLDIAKMLGFSKNDEFNQQIEKRHLKVKQLLLAMIKSLTADEARR